MEGMVSGKINKIGGRVPTQPNVHVGGGENTAEFAGFYKDRFGKFDIVPIHRLICQGESHSDSSNGADSLTINHGFG
jgi:hypothetical protein